MNHRGMFVNLINEKDYKVAVEVGVRQGWYSRLLLSNTNLQILYAIDPWNLNEENHDPFGSFGIAKRNLEIFGDRARMIKAKNEDVMHLFDAETIDFVYIDGLHDYESVKRDVNNWFIRLRKGGCLSGHDYCHNEWPGLARAVDEFAKENSLELLLTGVGDTYGESDYNKKSWYVFKK